MLWWTLQQLKSSSAETRIKAARALGAERQKKAVPSLLTTLQDQDPQVRLAAIEALGAIGHPASAEPLVSALMPARDTAEYESLVKAVSSIGSAAVAPLVKMLSSDNKQARRGSADALGKIKDPQAVNPLIQRLDDSRSEVRKAAALALGHIGDERALPALIKALAGRDLEMRRAAAEALGLIGAVEAVDALSNALSDASEPVQLAAVASLSRIGGLKAAASLRSAMSGSRKNVCDAAEASLRNMKYSPSSPEERAEISVIQGDFEAALAEGGAAVHALTRALGFKDPNMRAKAAELLGALQSEESIQPLLQVLKDHHASVQESAAKALARIGEAARAGLEEALAYYDASVIRVAAAALGDIGNPQSVPALADLIAANVRIPADYPELFDAVSAAAESLGRIAGRAASEITFTELGQLAELPPEICLSGPSPRRIDCAFLRDAAARELLNRK